MDEQRKLDVPTMMHSVLPLSKVPAPSLVRFPIQTLSIKQWKIFRGDTDKTFNFCRCITTIVGPSGSGKSSVLEALFALLRSWEMKKWDSHLCTPPIAAQKTSMMLQVSSGKFGLVSSGSGGPEGLQGRETFHLTKMLTVPDQFFMSLAFVPQDHGVRNPERYKGVSWCFVYDSLKSESVLGHLQQDPWKSYLWSISELKYHGNGEFSQGRGTTNKFGLVGLSGGQVDSILCILAIGMAEKQGNSNQMSTLILDEPGQNLGSLQRRRLRSILHSLGENVQVIIITHHVEMLDRMTLPRGVIRFTSPSSSMWKNTQFTSASYSELGGAISACATMTDSERAKLCQFLRSPENLDVFFATSLLLCEGGSDERAFRALDDIWCQDGWSRLECCVLSFKGKENLMVIWSAFQRILSDFALGVFVVLDLDAATSDGTLGGHVYHTLDKPPNKDLGRFGVDMHWLMRQTKPVAPQAIPSDSELLDKIGKEEHDASTFLVQFFLPVENVLSNFNESRERSEDLRRINNTYWMPYIKSQWKMINSFFRESGSVDIGKIHKRRSPELMDAYVTSLNRVFSATRGFKLFVWPPSVCDIEGVVFDKDWRANIIPRPIDFCQVDRSKTESRTSESFFDFYQANFCCDSFHFVRTRLDARGNDELFGMKISKCLNKDNKNSRPSLSSRLDPAKYWLSTLSATDFDSYMNLIANVEHSRLVRRDVIRVIIQEVFHATGVNDIERIICYNQYAREAALLRNMFEIVRQEILIVKDVTSPKKRAKKIEILSSLLQVIMDAVTCSGGDSSLVDQVNDFVTETSKSLKDDDLKSLLSSLVQKFSKSVDKEYDGSETDHVLAGAQEKSKEVLDMKESERKSSATPYESDENGSCTIEVIANDSTLKHWEKVAHLKSMQQRCEELILEVEARHIQEILGPQEGAARSLLKFTSKVLLTHFQHIKKEMSARFPGRDLHHLVREWLEQDHASNLNSPECLAQQNLWKLVILYVDLRTDLFHPLCSIMLKLRRMWN